MKSYLHWKMLIALFDGDKPSLIAGISLTTANSNLQQHGMYMKHFIVSNFRTLIIFVILFLNYTIMDNGMLFAFCYGPLHSRRKPILNIVFARTFPKEECGYLECLIDEHHYHLKELYPETSITMKMHSMVDLFYSKYFYKFYCIFTLYLFLLRFGPLINHWTAWFEAKQVFQALSKCWHYVTNYITVTPTWITTHYLQKTLKWAPVCI